MAFGKLSVYMSSALVNMYYKDTNLKAIHNNTL